MNFFWRATFCFVVLGEIVLAYSYGGYRKTFCQTIKIKNGRVRHRQKSSFAQFLCNKGYRLAGEKYAKCISGNWDAKPPKCVRAVCPKIRPPANGLIYPSHGGGVLNFFCKPGYDLKGPFAAYCDGARWDTYLPSCLESNRTASLSCDFENEDLCGWSHDLNHNFDWTRLNFKTPSGHIGTGPSFDHSKGEGGDGYYMYIESSSRNVNDTARLISPVYARQDNATCLEFYYHMYGLHIGELRAYVKKSRDSWDLQPETSIFRKSGNHGDRWLRSFTMLRPIDDDFQVIFEAVRGDSYMSDIAIDDVKLIEDCTIYVDEETSTTESEEATNAIGIQSCLNRCNGDSNVTSSNTFQIACDCDENCVERNSCCPDYAAICVMGSFDFSTEYFFSEDTILVNTTRAKLQTNTSTTASKPVSRVTNKTTLVMNMTSMTSKPNTTVSTMTSIRTVSATNNTTPSTTTKVASMATKPMQPKSTQLINVNKTMKSTTKATSTFVISTTSKPPTITRLTYKPPTYKSTTTYKPLIYKPPRFKPSTPRQSTSKPSTTSKPPTIIATTKTSEKSTKKTVWYNDIVTIPNGLTQEETFPPLEETTMHFTSLSTDKYDHLRAENARPVSEKSKNSNKPVVVGVLAVCLAIVVISGVVFVARKYSYRCLRRMKKLNGGNGDSQSDVRFLTSDEILNFSVASPEDFDM